MTHLCRIGCVAAFLLMGTSFSQAQSTADAYFHEAARQYVTDNVPAARRAVEQGLQLAPSDPRLLALQKKLRDGTQPKEKKRDSSSTGSQDGSQQNQNSSPNSSSAGGQAPSPEQSGAAQTGPQNAPQSEQGGSRPTAREQRDDPQGPAAQSSGRRPVPRPTRADTMRGGRGGHATALSRDQAERLLHALEGQERQLLRQLRLRSSSRQKVEKDW
jgi:hypothetical protein